MTKTVDQMENEIIRVVVDSALAEGFCLSVWDGGEMAVRRSTNADEIIAALKATDADTLHYYRMDAMQRPVHWGVVVLIYGNCGWDVISDNSIKLEPYLKAASELADQLSD